MIRVSAFIWVIVLALLGIGLFQVKYNVQSKEAELRGINKQIDANRSAIHVLDAEWSYLNDPTRLADLTRRHTDLTPTQASQIKHFSDLPQRPTTARPDLPALSNAAPQQTAPATAAVAPVQPSPTSSTGGVMQASATAGSLPSAAPTIASSTAAPVNGAAAEVKLTTIAGAKTATAPAANQGANTSNKSVTESAAKPGADEVIDAILADMQRQQQGGATTPQAGDQ